MTMRNKRDHYKEALKEISKKKHDINKVLLLLEKSIEKGSPESAYALGTWYLHGKHVEKNVKKAVALLRKAANYNLPNALFDLAVCYEIGNGVKKNLRLAFEYYVKASLYGDNDSIFEIGRCYYYGIGINKNRRLAKIWLDRAENLKIYREKELKVKKVTFIKKGKRQSKRQWGQART